MTTFCHTVFAAMVTKATTVVVPISHNEALALQGHQAPPTHLLKSARDVRLLTRLPNIRASWSADTQRNIPCLLEVHGLGKGPQLAIGQPPDRCRRRPDLPFYPLPFFLCQLPSWLHYLPDQKFRWCSAVRRSPASWGFLRPPGTPTA